MLLDMQRVSGFQKKKILGEPRISSNIAGMHGMFGWLQVQVQVQGPCAVWKQCARGDGGNVVGKGLKEIILMWTNRVN